MGGRLTLLVLSVLFVLVLGEFAVRVIGENPYRDSVPARVHRLRLHPPRLDLSYDRSAIDRVDRVVRFRTDQRAYQLPGRRFAEADATIVFLGASTTECSLVKEELRFPTLVSSVLEQQGLRVNTLNAARSAGSSHHSLNVLLNHVVADRPEAVVMMHATNDVGILARQGSYRNHMEEALDLRMATRWALQRVSSDLFLVAYLRRWVYGFRGSRVRDPTRLVGQPRQSQRLPQEEFAARLRAFGAIARAFGIQPVLMTQPHAASLRNELTPEWMDSTNQTRFNQEVRDVAAAEGVPFVDLERHVMDIEGWNQPMRIFYDGIHVTDHGSRIYAEYIARRLIETGVVGRAETSHAPLARHGAR